MYICRTYNLILPRKISFHSWKPLLSTSLSHKDINLSKLQNRSLLKATISNQRSQSHSFKSIQQNAVLHKTLNFLSGFSNSGRNFSTSEPVRLYFIKTNQDKEKFTNYVFFSLVGLFIGLVTYFYLTLKHTQDYVFIEPEEPKKK